ncbi:hypothetical protein GCM10007981_11800 [Thermocladium modestius]|uniref:DUF3834 domain-containing protein n=1 Tax=Thermocladium modestius TaxID=62609 RepID=A0A830GUS0_9CREN|nr:DUF3834 domain-containing protein [Thermocladium modestius]GGP21152.1 hypothetical protein GCM10007981_11800 [Thermocladium modestius]
MNDKKMRIAAAPGPVSYPLVAYSLERDDVELVFSKDNANADAIFDSTVSLIKRGLRIDYVTVRGLMVLTPSVGRRIAVPTNRESSVILAKALAASRGGMELLPANDPLDAIAALKRGSADSAVVTANLAPGIRFEDLLNFVPGSCGVHVNGNPEAIIKVYEEGIAMLRRPGISMSIAAKLPINVKQDFIEGVIRSVEWGIHKLDYKEFKNVVSSLDASL